MRVKWNWNWRKLKLSEVEMKVKICLSLLSVSSGSKFLPEGDYRRKRKIIWVIVELFELSQTFSITFAPNRANRTQPKWKSFNELAHQSWVNFCGNVDDLHNFRGKARHKPHIITSSQLNAITQLIKSIIIHKPPWRRRRRLEEAAGSAPRTRRASIASLFRC